MIKEKKQLIFATYGGAVKFKGSLGFLLADESGDRILACYGQPAGHDPLSYRAEIYAFLAALRPINLLIEYNEGVFEEKCKMETKFHLFTDSKSMLDKLKELDEYPTAHLKTMMDSEWDVLYALHKAINTFSTTIPVEWVASHQYDDPKVNTSDLPLGAQLNIAAEKFATTGLHKLKLKPMV